MSTNQVDNKRIAKNTVMLYIRMFLLMIVSFYTSRVILEALGVEDYGIYDVVGGVVALLGFISGSLSGACSRYITYEIGKGSNGNVLKVFNCTLTIFYILAIIVLLVAESLGLWFVKTQLTIPMTRLNAAIWVYQCSVITFLISIISIPYNATIIAYERMSAFALISIYEGIAKLVIALSLPYIVADKLIVYSILILITQISIRLIYILYCKRNFESIQKTSLLWDSSLSRELLSYSGWNLIGNLAVIGSNQGLSLLLNVFFGPIVNAARGIAVQVQGAVIQLLSGFTTAMRPQIVKSYACNDIESMHSLLLSGTKLSVFLTLLIVVPIYINAEYILGVWLKDIPDFTISFTRLLLISSLLAAYRVPTLIAIHATGDIKKFQIVEGIFLLTFVPIAYIALRWLNISPNTVFILYLTIEAITQIVRVQIVYPRINLRFAHYITKIILPTFFTLIPVVLFSYIQYNYLLITNFTTFIFSCLLSIVINITSIFLLGFSPVERVYLRSMCRSLVSKYSN